MTEILIILSIALAVDFLLRLAIPNPGEESPALCWAWMAELPSDGEPRITVTGREYFTGARDVNEAFLQARYSYGEVIQEVDNVRMPMRVTGVNVNRLGKNTWRANYTLEQMT